jgi:hypothetical protein
MTYYEIAERHLINMPIGSVIKIGATVGLSARFYQHQVSGIVQITPGAYCRAIGA